MSALFIASVLIAQQRIIRDRAVGGSIDVVGGGFIRTINLTDGTSICQTEAVRLSAPGKPDVWLIGAAHIGAKDYYTQIQALLDAQDVVLFEGVKSKKNLKGIPMSAINANEPKPFYQVLSDAIGLDFQLVDINYNRPNWINSDLSMTDLEALNKKGAHGKPTGFDMVEQMLEPNSPQAKMLGTFLASASPSIKEALKIFLVDQLVRVETLLPMLSDKTTMDVILTARNQATEAVLDTTMRRSPMPKSIGIFYGAAHQTDFEKVLRAKYGYKPVEQRWFTFAKADHRKLDAEGKQFLDTLNAMTKAAGK